MMSLYNSNSSLKTSDCVAILIAILMNLSIVALKEIFDDSSEFNIITMVFESIMPSLRNLRAFAFRKFK